MAQGIGKWCRPIRVVMGRILVLAVIMASFLGALWTSMSIIVAEDTSGGTPPTTPAVPRMEFASEIPTGILSRKPKSFFRNLQRRIDEEDPRLRCRRYNYQPNDPFQGRRRLFFGALIAEEPWEVLEIVATESYGIYAGMVFVEGNRTQNFDPRPLRRTHQIEPLRELFGVDNLQIRHYSDERPKFTGLRREHAQRQEILRGWRELGMTERDVGIVADADETFRRDFLRAAQECDIPQLDYASHQCHTPRVKLAASSRVFETSPECVTDRRGWYHPEMVVGSCVEIIGNRSLHPLAFRDGPRRAHGHGRACSGDFSKLHEGRHPLWSAADFRMLCGQQAQRSEEEEDVTNSTTHTGFHFHNFFTDFNATRMKYHTYGHAVKARRAFTAPLEEIGKNDLKLMYRCARNLPDDTDQKWKRIVGGLNASREPLPLYFHDSDYIRRRHQWVQEQVRLDDQMVSAMKNSSKRRTEVSQDLGRI